MLSCFTSINVLFDQYNVGKKSKRTLIEVKCCPVLLRLILISTFLCTVKMPKNDLFLNCQRKPKQLSKKELSNVAPASGYWCQKDHKLVSGNVNLMTIVLELFEIYRNSSKNNRQGKFWSSIINRETNLQS